MVCARPELKHRQGCLALEQGQLSNASDAIIEALARALDLDDDERVHLYGLARPVPARRKRMMRAEVNGARGVGAAGLDAVGAGAAARAAE